MRQLEWHLIHQLTELHPKLTHRSMPHLAKFTHGHPPEAFKQLRLGLFEQFQIGAWEDDAKRLIRLNNARGIARTDADQHFTQTIAQLFWNSTDHAKIHEGQLPGPFFSV